MMPKPSTLSSAMILRRAQCGQRLAIQPANVKRIRVGQPRLGGEGRDEAAPGQQRWGARVQPAIGIGKGPRPRLYACQPGGRSVDLTRLLLLVDEVEPGMGDAVPAKVHAAGCHLADLIRLQVERGRQRSLVAYLLGNQRAQHWFRWGRQLALQY